MKKLKIILEGFLMLIDLKSIFLRGPYRQKNNYYFFDSDENLHIYVKSKIKWGNSPELFYIFFIENELS